MSMRKSVLLGTVASLIVTSLLPASALASGSIVKTKNRYGQSIYVVAPPAGMSIANGKPKHMLQVKNPYNQDPELLRQVVAYSSEHAAGTIIVDTGSKFLYLVLKNGRAMRYGIGVARSGFEWSGTHKITAKKEWPGWTPPAEMRVREPHLPAYMPGGIDNPLGARALYLGSTLYRLHGTTQPWSIGKRVSSGCIRLTNEDIKDLYTRVAIGSRVVVI